MEDLSRCHATPRHAHATAQPISLRIHLSTYLCSLQRESMCMYVLVSTLSCTNIISYATRRPVPAFANAHACPFWHCALFQLPSADLVTGDLPHFEPGR